MCRHFICKIQENEREIKHLFSLYQGVISSQEREREREMEVVRREILKFLTINEYTP